MTTNSSPPPFFLHKSPKWLLVSAYLFVLLMVPSCANTEINQSKSGGGPVNIASGDESEGMVKLETLIKISHPAQLVAWNPDGKHVAVTGRTPEISVWDIEKHRLVMSLRKSKKGGHSAIAYSPDGRYLASGAGVISLWDAKTGTLLHDIVGPYIDMTRPQPIGVQSISFSPDGDTVAVTYSSIGRGGGFAICLFESETGKLVRSIESEGLTTTGVIFSKNGKQLFGTRFYSTGERDQRGAPVTYLVTNTELNVWDALSGQKTSTIKNIHVLAPWAFAASPDSKIFATGSWTGEIQSTRNRKTGEFHTIKNNDPIRLWDAKTGQLRSELAVSSHIRSLNFSPDGTLLVSCQGADRATHDPIWLWRVSSGELIQKIKFHEYRDTPTCGFSPDGTRLAAVVGFDLAIYSVGR
jgi:WD40 repeat protein